MLTGTHSSSANVPASANCHRCHLLSYCQEVSHNSDDADDSPPPPTSLKVRAGEHLYWHQDRVQAIYSLKRGCLKSYVIDLAGNEQVREFLHPGDLVGLDALNDNTAGSGIQALVDTELCMVPMRRSHALTRARQALQEPLIQQLSTQLDRAYAMAGDCSAETRIARFLMDLSARSEDPLQFTLHMGRRDIANYLRLVTETVSRTLTRFQQREWITVRRREIQLLNTDALCQQAGLSGSEFIGAAA